MPSAPPPAAETIPWSRLRPTWRSLPLRDRRNYLRAAAEHLHALWSHGASPSTLPISLMTFTRSNGVTTALLPDADPAYPHRPVPPHALLDALAGWSVQMRDTISAREGYYVLRYFMRKEDLDRPARRHAMRTLAGMTSRRICQTAATLYRENLAAENPDDDGSRGIRCEWHPDTSATARRLLDAIEAIECDPATNYLKNNPIIRVMRANLLGHDVLLKRYDLPRRIDRLKYLFRPSRARRAWAAGRTLIGLGIPTPEPLGFLEIYEGRVAVRSYVITEFMADGVSTYAWSKANYGHRPAEWREQFRHDLLASLLSLYDRGIYHADTKSPNLLMMHPDDPARRTFYWIDLECVNPGVAPSRHEIVRNLVQLNGSFRHWVPDEDRLAFLRDAACRYPWLDHPAVIDKIRRWTLKRWKNEVTKHIGP